jgi:hypothetical protein
VSETDSSFPLPPETRQVLYGNENIQRIVVQSLSWVKEELDGCVESTEIAMNVTLDAIWNGYAQLKKKGVILRVVTEVTPDNIFYVKKLMGLFEVRHLKGVKTNFGMVDRKECLLYSNKHGKDEQQDLSITTSLVLPLIQEILKILLYLHRIQLGKHILSKMPNRWYIEGA